MGRSLTGVFAATFTVALALVTVSATIIATTSNACSDHVHAVLSSPPCDDVLATMTNGSASASGRVVDTDACATTFRSMLAPRSSSSVSSSSAQATLPCSMSLVRVTDSTQGRLRRLSTGPHIKYNCTLDLSEPTSQTDTRLRVVVDCEEIRSDEGRLVAYICGGIALALAVLLGFAMMFDPLLDTPVTHPVYVRQTTPA